jgi:hypothetical protein
MQIIDTGAFGTRSAVLRLRRRGSELNFVVFPMMHVATPAFYREVTRRLGGCAVVVTEGVSGRSPLVWALTLTYRIIPANRRSGLVQQHIDYAALGVPVIRPDMSSAEFGKSWQALPLRLRLLVWCMLPAVVVAQLFGGRKSLLVPEVALDDDDVPETDMEERFEEAFMGERDNRLFAALAELHETRSHERIDIGIVYGAKHVPDLVHRLASTLGYRPRQADWITVVDW